MTERRLIFLTEVDLPPYCFMSEAVEWVAFGRVPEMQHHIDSTMERSVDYRFHWKLMPDNFQPNTEFPWFDRLEFESLLIPIVEEYFEAAEKCFDESIGWLPSRIAMCEAEDSKIIIDEDGTEYELWGKLAEEYRQKLIELAPLKAIVDEVEARFTPHREIACAKLFQLLASGKIRSEGINEERWQQLTDEGEYKKAATFEPVPPQTFSLAQDWLSNEMYIETTKYVALRVCTQDILNHHDFLFQPGQEVMVKRLGASYISGNTGSRHRKAQLGRRAVIDWSAMKSHFADMLRRGALPEGKESCIYELIVFAEQNLGKTPSRTAIQRNMAAELDAHYAQK